MAAANRTSRLGAMFDVLKKHYRPVPPADPQRPILEHLLFACCLENTRYEIAEEAFGALLVAFFDYNEMRVSSIRELSEVMAVLPDARSAAFRVKRCLQDVFEAEYSFDLEDCRKGNLGPTVERLSKIKGAGPFAVSYVVQTALGGHSLPVDSSTLAALLVLDLVTEKNVEEGVVPGLERAVSKSQGAACGSLLHQLGADFFANPYDPGLHAILLAIDPECEARLPSRGAKKPKAEAAEAPAPGDAETPARSKRVKKKGPDAAAVLEVGAGCQTEGEAADKGPGAKKKTPAVQKEPKESKETVPGKTRPRKAVPAIRKKKAEEPAEQEAGEKPKKRAAAQISKKKPR